MLLHDPGRSSGRDTAPAIPSALGVPPVAHWDKYEVLELLGRGGMGMVYKARDRQLDRVVALKFVRGSDPDYSSRFMREARAQSRVDHPNVCGVYEVGEISGKAYIALQFVDGLPLHEAAANMTLPEKIKVMQDIALAVHEAHKLGVIHRDLKPGNILVQHVDNVWQPIVTDFGLSYEIGVGPEILEPGVVMGTPMYMSPEQAQGNTQVVDRRSDVYSLGATLYEILTARSIFPDSSSSSRILEYVAKEDPVPPRQLVPELPEDLERIVLKCLAKDPQVRYQTAGALAEDLGSFLEGMPISIVPPSTLQRGAVFASENAGRLLVWLLITAVVGCGSMFLVDWQSDARKNRHMLALRSQVVEQVSKEVREIEFILKESELRPLHDVRPDRQQARDILRVAEASMADLDPSDSTGRLQVHAFLGQARIALQDWKDAVADLRPATVLGNPDVHLALGRALGELYREACDKIGYPNGEGDAVEWLAHQRTAVAQQYLTPALSEVGQALSTGSRTELALTQARLALYGHNYVDVTRHAKEISDSDQGSAEARELEADAARSAATEALDRGNYEAAYPLLEQATLAYARAIEVARGRGSLYRKTAQAWFQTAEIDNQWRKSPESSIKKATELIEHGAIVADPDDAESYVALFYVGVLRYRARLVKIDEQRQELDRLIRVASRAVELDSKSPPSLVALGIAHIYRGSYDYFHGDRGASWWQLAVSELKRALNYAPIDPRASNALGIAHRWLGDELEKEGKDPKEEWRVARESYDRALRLDPRYLRACVSLVELSALTAEHEEAIGEDPRSEVDAASETGQQCLILDPKSFLVLDAEARGFLAAGRASLANGEDPRLRLMQATRSLTLSEDSSPEHQELWIQKAEAMRIEARFLIARGENPTEQLARGFAYTSHALRLTPDSSAAHLKFAELGILAARSGSAPDKTWAQALEHAEKALQIDSLLPEAHIALAEIYRHLALRRDLTALRAGFSHIDEALRLNPGLRAAAEVRKALEQLNATFTESK